MPLIYSSNMTTQKKLWPFYSAEKPLALSLRLFPPTNVFPITHSQAKTQLFKRFLDVCPNPLYEARTTQQSIFQVKTSVGDIDCRFKYNPSSQWVTLEPIKQFKKPRAKLMFRLDSHFEPGVMIIHHDPDGLFYELFGHDKRWQALDTLLNARASSYDAPKAKAALTRLKLQQDHVSTFGQVPHSMVQRVVSALLRHVPDELRGLKAFGYRIVCAERVTDLLPNLKNCVIKGSKGKMRYDSCMGMACTLDDPKQLVIAHKYFSHRKQREVINDDIERTTHHEVGHGRSYKDDTIHNWPEFKLLYGDDLVDLSAQQQADLADFLDIGVSELETEHARSEIFANTYTHPFEAEDIDFNAYLPRIMRFMQRHVVRLPLTPYIENSQGFLSAFRRQGHATASP